MAVIEGGMKCCKYSTILINLVFLIIGVILIVVGAMTLTGQNQALSESASSAATIAGTSSNTPAIVAIVGGSLMFIIAFCGGVGSWLESKMLLYIYLGFLLLIFILEVVAAILAFTKSSVVFENAEKMMKNSMVEYQNNTKIHQAWDKTQEKYDCCGTFNYTDWFNALDVGPQASIVPVSCCKNITLCGDSKDYVPVTPASKVSIYQNGCFNEVKANFDYKAVGILAIIVAFILLLGAAIAGCLINAINKGYEAVE